MRYTTSMSVSSNKSSGTSSDKRLFDQAVAVLKSNDRGHYVAPAKDLYPHQWLWDSCFTAIGLRHLDIDRAQLELTSLLRGQWRNGMVPHMLFESDGYMQRDWGVWKSELNPNAPDEIATSGITQPPMLAEAVVRIGQKLSLPERRTWYKQMYPHLLAYHHWLYAERDPHDEGLVLLIHPWESGLDNTPPWMAELHQHQLPGWIRLLQTLHLDPLIGLFRTDTRFVARAERLTNVEALVMYSTQRRLRRKRYDINAILSRSMFTIEDLAFNCILIRANEHLEHIAQTIRQEIPAKLTAHMHKSRKALEQLWDPYGRQYYSRNFGSHQLLKETSIATLLPLYAGCITKERAAVLVEMLENESQFGSAYPIPSVPLDSPYFDGKRYWQGPTWVNMTWLVIDGLERYGYKDHAGALRDSVIDMAKQHGIAEYYGPETGEPLGADDFSWTAALVIDMLRKGK